MITFINRNYNYWSLTSLKYFFNQFRAKIFKVEKINTHGGSIRVYIKKNSRIKINPSVKKILKEEEKFGIKNFSTYQDFGNKILKLKKML